MANLQGKYASKKKANNDDVVHLTTSLAGYTNSRGDLEHISI